MQNKKVKVGAGRAVASIKQINENGEITAVATTELPVFRYDWARDQAFEEILDVQESSIRMSRLESGLPILKSHDDSGLESVLGKTVGFEFTEDRKLLVRFKLSSREDVAPVKKDIEDGILDNVSVGYRVYRYDEDRTSTDETLVLRATDWEPLEVSLVAVPADHDAKIVSRQDGIDNAFSVPVVCNNRSSKEVDEMPDQKNTGPAADNVEPTVKQERTQESVDLDALRAEAAKAERERVAKIRKLSRAVGLTDEFVDALVEKGTEIDEASQLIIAERAAQDAKKDVQTVGVEIVRDEGETLARGAKDALRTMMLTSHTKDVGAAKAKVAADKDADMENASRFLSTGGDFNHFLRTYAIEKFGYSKVAGMNDVQLRSAAMLTASDLPLYFADSMNKSFKDIFEMPSNERLYELLADRVQANDFRTQYINFLDPNFDLYAEGTTPSEGGLAGDASESEERASYSLSTYKMDKMLGRKAIVNDDIGQFVLMWSKRAAEAIIRLEAQLVWLTTINANATYTGDSVALFDTASHGNLLGSNPITGSTALSSAMAQMMEQKTLAGEMAGRMPTHLLVPPKQHGRALSITAGTAYNNASDEDNRLLGQGLQPVVVPYLSDAADATNGSDTSWYLLDANRKPLVVAGLAGGDGLSEAFTVEYVNGEGVKMCVLHDVAVAIQDYRAIQKNTA